MPNVDLQSLKAREREFLKQELYDLVHLALADHAAVQEEEDPPYRAIAARINESAFKIVNLCGSLEVITRQEGRKPSVATPDDNKTKPDVKAWLDGRRGRRMKVVADLADDETE